MVRTVLGKAMWVGRATIFLVGLAMILALVFGVATKALGATGSKFILGGTNVAGTVSKLTADISGPALQLVNGSTGAGATALDLSVAPGKPPLTVNAGAGTATNLSADELDGKDASSFAASAHPHAGEDITSGTVSEARIDGSVARDGEIVPTVQAGDGSGSGLDADQLDGKDSTAFSGANHTHSGTDINRGTVDADRVEDGPGSNLNADTLDGKDSTVFGLGTEHSNAKANTCDTPGTYECAPVEIVVPAGKTYKVSVWSSATLSGYGLAGGQLVSYCSAARMPGTDSVMCITPSSSLSGGNSSGNALVTLPQDQFISVSSSGEKTLTAGTWTISTRIVPERELGPACCDDVITKVLVRDASAPQPTGITRR